MEEFENLSAFLDHVALVMDNDADDSASKVTILTIHAAKGLEFDTVFLAGWEEGVFPSQRSLDEGGNASLEEERRSEEHTSELQSLMRISYAVFCLKKKKLN